MFEFLDAIARPFSALAVGEVFIFIKLGPGWSYNGDSPNIPQVQVKLDERGFGALGGNNWTICPNPEEAQVIPVRVFDRLKSRQLQTG